MRLFIITVSVSQRPDFVNAWLRTPTRCYASIVARSPHLAARTWRCILNKLSIIIPKPHTQAFLGQVDGD